MMNRVFVAVLLFASVSLARAEDLNLRIVGDARPTFQKMWNADQLKKGMNLISTSPNGQKLWANIKGEEGFAIVDWVITDTAGKVLPSLFVKIEGAGPRAAEYPGDCYECTKSPEGPPSGDKNCHKVPCPVRVPCCPNKHWCCVK